MKFMKVKESTLDNPRENLCPAVWEQTGLNQYKIKPDVKSKILNIIDIIKTTFGFNDVIPVLVGSITSNQYSQESDIDVHIWIDNIADDKCEQLNEDLKYWMANESEKNPDKFQIDGYRLEFYFQLNKYSDLASVGCYDILNERWIVQSELKDLDYDPYSDFYYEGIKIMSDITWKIRQIILEIYEQCIIYLNVQNQEFRPKIETNIVGLIAKAKQLRDESKEIRNSDIKPYDEQTSIMTRNDRQTHVHDAAYKFLEKFGYVKILRNIHHIQKKLDKNEITFPNAVMEILKTIDENLGIKQITGTEPNEKSDQRYSVQFMG